MPTTNPELLALKALAYDLIVEREQTQANLVKVTGEIQRLLSEQNTADEALISAMNDEEPPAVDVADRHPVA